MVSIVIHVQYTLTCHDTVSKSMIHVHLTNIVFHVDLLCGFHNDRILKHARKLYYTSQNNNVEIASLMRMRYVVVSGLQKISHQNP